MPATGAEAAASDCRRDVGIALALTVVVACAYANALDASFQFDDFAVIIDNPGVQSLDAWWRSMPGIRPLLKLSYALNQGLWPGATGFHAVNVLIHLVNALLVWRLGLVWLPRLGVAEPAARWAAPVAALLFALHPATTEAVTYASGRSISLAALFLLASWLADARAHAQGSRGNGLSALLFGAALATRETSVIAPLALVLLAGCSRDVPFRVVLQRLRGHALVLLMAVLAAVTTGTYQRFFDTSLRARDVGEQWLAQLGAHAYLVQMPLFGLRTNIDPPLSSAMVLDAGNVAVLVGFGILMVAALLARRRWPWLAFGLLWYLLQLAPTNSLLPRLDLANDRHLYLALLGPAWIAAVMLARWRLRGVAFNITGLLLITLGVASVLRNAEYASETALWTASLRSDPRNARAWNNLGFALRNGGELARARSAYGCALAINPRHEQAILNLDALEQAAVPGRSGRAVIPIVTGEPACPVASAVGMPR